MDIECWGVTSQSKLIRPEDLKKKIDELKKQEVSIASLNGSFDLLHAGHLKILFEASEQADCLIVALNSDASIQKYKSPTRPIIPLRYRLEMLAALQCVDYVTWFEETDPCALLEIIRPDVHINGSEYGAECIEAQTVKNHGGEIYVCELAPGLSTSQIVSKILKEEACDYSVH